MGNCKRRIIAPPPDRSQGLIGYASFRGKTFAVCDDGLLDTLGIECGIVWLTWKIQIQTTENPTGKRATSILNVFRRRTIASVQAGAGFFDCSGIPRNKESGVTFCFVLLLNIDEWDTAVSIHTGVRGKPLHRIGPSAVQLQGFEHRISFLCVELIDDQDVRLPVKALAILAEDFDEPRAVPEFNRVGLNEHGLVKDGITSDELLGEDPGSSFA